jgi:tRNA (cytidine/uridine-2'-O-)-methyltransferase
MRENSLQFFSSSWPMDPTTPILHVALVEPDIAPNVGTIARLCAADGIRLHLIGKLGFRLTDHALRRAGLDYWHLVDCHQHPSWDVFRALVPNVRCLAFSAHARTCYTKSNFQRGDCLVFGSETKGLPAALLHHPQGLPSFTIPMLTGQVRCLNVAVSVGIVVYEALRQIEHW